MEEELHCKDEKQIGPAEEVNRSEWIGRLVRLKN
jgi:hypothetical protein